MTTPSTTTLTAEQMAELRALCEDKKRFGYFWMEMSVEKVLEILAAASRTRELEALMATTQDTLEAWEDLSKAKEIRIGQLAARAEAAEAEVARLREALRPFGERGAHLSETLPDDDLLSISAGELRKAARALGEQP